MPAHKNRAPVRPDQRETDLARIHIMKKELGLTTDEYRDVMATVCNGIRSSAELDITSRQRFLRHLETCRSLAKPAPSRPVPAPLTKPQRLMWSLWQQLADRKAIEKRSMKALLAYIERQTGVAQLTWLNGAQEDLVIESMKKWLKRLQEPKA